MAQALLEAAFVTSELPVIVSLEMHCCHKQQGRCAALMRAILGGSLLLHEEVWALERTSLTPRGLLRKVIVKSKLPPDWMVDRYADAAAGEATPPPPRSVVGMVASSLVETLEETSHRVGAGLEEASLRVGALARERLGGLEEASGRVGDLARDLKHETSQAWHSIA